jgi:tetratricopeptide (TPR) repeat protein
VKHTRWKIEATTLVTPEENLYAIDCIKIVALAQTGKAEEAIAAGREALQKHGEHGEVRLALAFALCASHLYADTLECLKNISMKVSAADTIEQKCLAALACLGLDQDQEAEEHLKDAAKLNPLNSDITAVQAICLARKGEWDKALAKVDETITRDPYSTEAIWVRKKIHEHKGDAAAAAADGRALENLHFVSYLDPLLPDKALAPEV